MYFSVEVAVADIRVMHPNRMKMKSMLCCPKVPSAMLGWRMVAARWIHSISSTTAKSRATRMGSPSSQS